MSTVLDLTQGFQPLTHEQETRILEPLDPWSDEMARKVAVQDFDQAEVYRTVNHDWRWRNADELYLGWVQQKYWQGTKIPRASIPVFVAFEQVEALLPKVVGALFSDNPWFEADPDFSTGTTAQQARQWQAHVYSQLEATQVREKVRRTVKSALIYGDGISGLSWESQEIQNLKYVPRWVPKDPRNVTSFARPPEMRRILDKQKTKTIQNRPVLDSISIKDFYINPNAPSPIIQDAGYVAIRALKPIQYFDSLRGNKEFNIPPNDQLHQLALMKPSAQGDATKSTSELMRSGQWTPQIDQTVDPANRRIEVIAYWTPDRVVWVLNRALTILNKPNPYGFIPFYHAWYADVLDRFYSQGICDVTEGEQRLQVSTLGGRLDEMSLNIHRPVQVRRGLNIPAYQLRVSPGQVIQVDTPGEDYVLTAVENITQQAYIEVTASEARVQKTTGLSDFMANGMQQAGGNSASRTASGITAQVQYGSSRIQYLVENLENTYIEPILNDVVKLNQLYPPIGTPLAQVLALSKVKLFMRAAAKMQSKMAILQTFPLFFQAAANPGFMEQLSRSGQTVDFGEMFQMLLDATGYRNRADLIRKLTPQEMQMLNQPPAEAQLRMQMQRERLQGQAQIQQGKQQHQTELESMKLDAAHDQTHQQTMSELSRALLPIAMEHALGGGEGTSA